MPMDRITRKEFHAMAVSEIERVGLLICPTTKMFKKEQPQIILLTCIFAQDGCAAVSFSELEIAQNVRRKSAEAIISERVQRAIFALRDHLKDRRAA